MSSKSWAAAALLPAVFVLLARAQGRAAAEQSGTAITGVYTGTLSCSQQNFTLKLSLVGTANGVAGRRPDRDHHHGRDLSGPGSVPGSDSI